jgi:hypothetical protein
MSVLDLVETSPDLDETNRLSLPSDSTVAGWPLLTRRREGRLVEVSVASVHLPRRYKSAS